MRYEKKDRKEINLHGMSLNRDRQHSLGKNVGIELDADADDRSFTLKNFSGRIIIMISASLTRSALLMRLIC